MSYLSDAAQRKSWFALSASLVLADQLSKIWIHATRVGEPKLEIISGWLNFVYSRNPGGLFGYFSNLGEPWRTLLLTLLPFVAIAMILHFLIRGEDEGPAARLALSLILGGALGNLIDRIFRGEVIDFIDAQASGSLGVWLYEKFGTTHWHTFNLADSFIVCGAVLLLITSFRPRRPQPVDS
jgi:signal peptidase II